MRISLERSHGYKRYPHLAPESIKITRLIFAAKFKKDIKPTVSDGPCPNIDRYCLLDGCQATRRGWRGCAKMRKEPGNNAPLGEGVKHTFEIYDGYVKAVSCVHYYHTIRIGDIKMVKMVMLGLVFPFFASS